MLIASLWCYFSHTWGHVWPTEHICDNLVLNQWTVYTNSLTLSDNSSAIENCIFDLMDICLFDLELFYINIDSCCVTHTEVNIRPTEHISGQRELDIELFICTHWCLLILIQLYRSPCLTYWTSRKLVLDQLVPILHLMLDKPDSYAVLHIWPKVHISGQRVFNLELSTLNFWTFHTLLLTSSDVKSPIQKSILDLLNIFLAN